MDNRLLTFAFAALTAPAAFVTLSGLNNIPTADVTPPRVGVIRASTSTFNRTPP